MKLIILGQGLLQLVVLINVVYKCSDFNELSPDSKPFRPSPQIDGIDQKYFLIGRQSNFVGQSQPTTSVEQSQPTSFLGSFVGQNQPTSIVDKNQPTSFVGQNQPSTFVGQNQPSNFVAHNQPTHFVGQNQPTTYVSQTPFIQQSAFVEQSFAPSTNFVGQNSFVDQTVSPVIKHSSFVGQNITPNFQNNPLLTHPSTVGHNTQQQTVDQKHRIFSQNVAPKQTEPVGQHFRESRHIFFDNSTLFDDDDNDDEDEIDSPSDRIFRGWELDPHEFPWMVKLMVSLSSINTDNIFDKA